MLFRYCCPLKSLNVLRIIANIQYNTIQMGRNIQIFFPLYVLDINNNIPIHGLKSDTTFYELSESKRSPLED
jgi:hypothetical protein